MYKLFNENTTYTLANGRVVTGDELIADEQYPLVGKTTCVMNICDGIVYSIVGLEQTCEPIGIDTSDPESAVVELNTYMTNIVKTKLARELAQPSVEKVARFMAVSLTDEQAIEVLDLYPEYELNHEYKQNDRFQYNNSLYKVNQAHTSQEQWVPGDEGTEALYTNLMLDESGHQIWKQPTGAHDAYNTGDVVNYNGKLYISTIDGNVYSPDVYPQGWQEYSEE